MLREDRFERGCIPEGKVLPGDLKYQSCAPRLPEDKEGITFSGEWQTVWTTLVVRLWYSQEFEHRELWRNAVEFASPKDYALGLKIDNRQGEGVTTISLYFDKEVPDDRARRGSLTPPDSRPQVSDAAA